VKILLRPDDIAEAFYKGDGEWRICITPHRFGLAADLHAVMMMPFGVAMAMPAVATVVAVIVLRRSGGGDTKAGDHDPGCDEMCDFHFPVLSARGSGWSPLYASS
jgi:hypothetical protein